MPYSPTTPVWNTPNLHYSGEQVTIGDWNNLANDVALLYAKPWMKYYLTGGGQTVGSAVNQGTGIFTSGGSSSYRLIQNSPLSGVGSYSVSSGGVITLPSGLNGLYRVKAQVWWRNTGPGNRARASIGWIGGSGVYVVEMAAWESGQSDGTYQYGTARIDSIFPCNSTPYGTVTSLQIYLASNANGCVIYSADPGPSGGGATINSGSSPPAYVTWVEVEYTGASDGTF